MYGQIYDSSNEDSYQKNKTKNQIFEKYFDNLTFENEWAAFLSSELSLLTAINHNYQLIYPCNVYTLEQHGHYQPTSNTNYNTNGSNTASSSSNNNNNNVSKSSGNSIEVEGMGEGVRVDEGGVNRQEVYDILLGYNKARFKQQYYYKHFNMKTNILDHIYPHNNSNKGYSNNNSNKKSSTTSASPSGDLNLLPSIQTKAAGTTRNLPPITTSYTPRNMSSNTTTTTSPPTTLPTSTSTNNTATTTGAVGGKSHTSRIRYRSDDVTPLIVTPPPSSSSYPSSHSLSAREASLSAHDQTGIRYTTTATTTADARAPARGLASSDVYATHTEHLKRNTITNINTPAVGEEEEEEEEIIDIERYNRIVLSLLQSLEKSLGSDEDSNPVPPSFHTPSSSLTTLPKRTNNAAHAPTAPPRSLEVAEVQTPYRPKANRAAYTVSSIPPFKGSSGGPTTDRTVNVNTTSLSSQATSHSHSKASPSPLLVPYAPTSASALNTLPSPRRRILRPAQPDIYTSAATTQTDTAVTAKKSLTQYNIQAYKPTSNDYTNNNDIINDDFPEGNYGGYSTRSNSNGSQQEEGEDEEEGFGGFVDLLYDPGGSGGEGDVDDDDLMMMCSEVTVNNRDNSIRSSSGTSMAEPPISKAPATLSSSSTTATTNGGPKKVSKAPTTGSLTAAVIVDDNGYEITDEEIEKVSRKLKQLVMRSICLYMHILPYLYTCV